MMPGAGQLNSLIDILKPVDTQDLTTGETTTEYQVQYQNIPAKKEDTSGGGGRRGLQVEEDVKSVITIPYVADVGTHCRVRVHRAGFGCSDSLEDATLEIVSVLDRTDLKRWTELHCSEVKA